jgi:rhodanese-related sulfurtransferase
VPSGKSIAAILREALLVAVAAASFGFAANALSPRGLKLPNDYFPGDARLTNAPSRVAPSAPVQAAATNDDPEVAEAMRRIKEEGLQPIDRAETERLFHDPRYQQGLVIFIDARHEAEYADSHIPGAYCLDPYHMEQNLADVLNHCQNAEQVVVYCHGGECPDAESTTIDLGKDGVPAQKLFVYGGGFDEWSAKHLPLEKGARNSGVAPSASK